MSRRARIIIVVSGVLLALAGVGVALLPTIAGGAIEQKATQILSNREDVDMTWSSLELDWSGTLVITDIDATDTKRGVHATIERVEVSPQLGSMFSETPQIDAVLVRGVSATVDVDTLRDALSKPKEDAPKKPKDPNSLRARFMKTLRESPPEVTVEQADVRARWEEQEVATLSAQAATLTGEDATLRLVSKGSAKIVHEKLPEALRIERTWAVDATLGLEDRHAQVTLSSGEEGRPLADLSLPRVGHARFGSVTVDVALKERVFALEVDEVDVAAGADAHPIFALTAKRARAELGQERPVVSLTEPVAVVDPGRIGELQKIAGTLSPTLKGAVVKGIKQKVAEKLDRRSTLERAMGAATKALEALWWLDLEAEGGALVARISGDEGEEARELRLVEDLDATSSQGTIEARGASAGGVFETRAVFAKGSPIPLGAFVKVTSVDISKIPGMAQGRTLPNRGVRGRLGGHFDAQLTWVAPPGGPLGSVDPLEESTLSLSLDWRDGLVDLDGVADAPLTGIALGTDTVLRWSPQLSRWRIVDGEVRYNGLRATYEAELTDWPLDPVLTARVELDEARCHDIVHSLPEALLGPYHRAIFRGKVAPIVTVEYPIRDPMKLELTVDNLSDEDNPEFRRRWRRQNPDATDPFPAVEKDWHCRVDRMRVTREGWPEIEIASGPGSLRQARPRRYPPAGDNPNIHADVYWLNRPFVKEVTEGTSGKTEIKVGPGLDTYVSLSAMPAYVGASMYLSEEILFYQNRGVSLGLVEKAIRIDLERGRFVYGGSTVTQQLVKNLFLTRDKTLARKIQEAIISLRIDEIVSKDRVLELYVNIIEFGRDLYGIGPAAEFYFGKKATELSPLEAVFLAVIKPSPGYGQHLKKRGSTPEKGWMHKRIQTIFKRLVKYEIITQEEADAHAPYVLKWNRDGTYIDPGPRTPAEKTVDQEGLELIQNLFDD